MRISNKINFKRLIESRYSDVDQEVEYRFRAPHGESMASKIIGKKAINE